MKVYEVPIDEITPYEKNPRKGHDLEGIKNSIKKNGWTQPIVVNQDNVIAIGHGRYFAAKEMGMNLVPVYQMKMSKSRFLAIVAADNKVGSKSKWDMDLLAELMSEIDENEHELLQDTGFADKEIEALLQPDEPEPPRETEVEAHTRTVGEKKHVKLVQIYLNDVTFPKFISMVEELQSQYGLDNITEVIFQAVETQYDQLEK